MELGRDSDRDRSPCVCVCVCERESVCVRERVRERESQRVRRLLARPTLRRWTVTDETGVKQSLQGLVLTPTPHPPKAGVGPRR